MPNKRMDSNKKIIFSLLFLLVFTVGCVGKPSPSEKGAVVTAPPDDFTPYKNNVYDASYPTSWEVEDHESFVYFKATPANDSAVVQGKVSDAGAIQENVNVYIAPLKSPDQTLVDFFQNSVEGLMVTTKEFTVLSHEETTLSGVPAQKIVYTEESSGQKIQYLQVFAVKDGKAYVLTYTAPAESYSAHVKDAEAIINSFKIK